MKHEDRSHCKVWWLWFLLGHWYERNKTLALQWMEATTHTNRCYHLIINQKWQNQVWLQGLRIWRFRRQERRSSGCMQWLRVLVTARWTLACGDQSRSHTGLSTRSLHTAYTSRAIHSHLCGEPHQASCCGVKRWIMSSAVKWSIGSTTGFHNHGEGPY